MANVLVSYEGRERLSVDLSGVDPKKRVIRGDTLYMRPRSSKVLTEEELVAVKGQCTEDQLRFLRVHVDKSKEKKALAKVQEVPLIPVPEPPEKTAKGVAARAERLAKAAKEAKGPPRVVVDGPPNVVAGPVKAKAEAEGAKAGAKTEPKGKAAEASSKGSTKKKKKEASSANSG